MIDKEDVLIKNYNYLAQNAKKNAKAIKSIIIQLCQVDPKLALRCWYELLTQNVDRLNDDYNSNQFEYNTFGYNFIIDLEYHLIKEEFFKYAIRDFVSNRRLLRIIYTDYCISGYFSGWRIVAYLIRNHRLEEADVILSAIYNNKYFNSYSDLWENVISRFKYIDLDNYDGGGLISEANYRQDSQIQEFCMKWIERIADEEEHSKAQVYIMRIF